MLRLCTFGGLALERRDGSLPPRLRPQRLAILAVLAASGDRGVSRERLSALFWPDTDEEHARHSLRQALYALRQELGADVIRSDAALTFDRAALGSDVGEFRTAVAGGDRVRAATLAAGPFLDGFYLPGAAEFERWVAEERAALTTEATRVLLALAKEADVTADLDTAAEWWRRLTLLDPLSGRFALGFLKALARRGDRAGALAFARTHEKVVRRELEADPDPEIRRLEVELRALPSPAVVRIAPPLTPASAVAPVPEPDDATSRGPAGTRVPRSRRLLAGAAALAVLAVAGVLSLPRGDTLPTFAVGLIREDGVPDTLRIGGVLTDMLATNLARVSGLPVLANSRLFELMLPGQDTLVAGYADAARRAGATEILQGRLLAGPEWGLAMELQRVDLATGLVRGGYRITARDRYALVDSMTAAIARDLRLGLPAGSVADATTESPMAYRFYEEGLRAFYQYDWSAAARLMRAALAEDSTFVMAAYYLTKAGVEGFEEIEARRLALRLAARAPERERLTITADMLVANSDPAGAAVAESLVARYPNDPRALEIYARSLHGRGDWAGAVAATERAIAIDSASEPPERQNCSLCADLGQLAEHYLWWDSLPAAERTAQRYLRLRPRSHYPWHLFVVSSAVRGNVDAMRTYLRRFHEANPLETSPFYAARFYVLGEDYEQAWRVLQPILDSPREGEATEARWVWSIALRNQGRLTETLQLARIQPNPNDLAEAMIEIERGNARAAVAIFDARTRLDQSVWSPATQARQHAWAHTLLGMALAAAGDTARVRRLADTVAFWGQQSNYGRDRRAPHYLRGMLLVAQGRDAEAVGELEEAIHSPSLGFTRVNYELGRALLRLGRPAEAAVVVRSALHGSPDASNLYVTRTDLHELLAQAFDRSGQRDSAAVHYRAVVRAWEKADPPYHDRRNQARAWLARYARPLPSSAGPPSIESDSSGQR